MRALKITIVIAIVIVIFALVVTGAIFAGGTSVLDKLRGAVTAGVTGDLYETQNGGYIVGEKNAYLFVDHMLADGWVLRGTRDGVYTFERNGHVVEYQETPMLFGFESYELTE